MRAADIRTCGQSSDGGGGRTKPRCGTSWVTISQSSTPREKTSEGWGGGGKGREMMLSGEGEYAQGEDV